MADYARANSGGATHFGDKDALSSGDADKVIVGSQFDTEFNAIVTAVASKFESGDVATQAQAEGLTLDTVLITPHSLNDVLVDNAGMAKDIQQLADPGADRILFWDDSASAAALLTVGTGLSLSGTTLSSDDSAIAHDSLSGFVANEHINHANVDVIAGAGLTGGGAITGDVTLNVVGGNGITANANDVALSTSVAGLGLSYSSGVLAIDPTELTEISISDINTSQDGILISNNGVPNVLPWDEAGIPVVNVSNAAQTFALSDGQTMQVLTSISANREWTVPTNAAVGFEIGTTILVADRDGDGSFDLTVEGSTGVTLTSFLRSASGTSSTHTILPGGTAALVKVASDEWMMFGNIA